MPSPIGNENAAVALAGGGAGWPDWADTACIQREAVSLANDVAVPANTNTFIHTLLPGCPSGIGGISKAPQVGRWWGWQGWATFIVAAGAAAANVQIFFCYPSGTPFQAGQPVFPTQVNGAAGGVPPTNLTGIVSGMENWIFPIPANATVIIPVYGRSIEIQPTSGQYAEITQIGSIVGQAPPNGGYFKGNTASVPLVQTLCYASAAVTVKKGSQAFMNFLPVHPEFEQGNGNLGVPLGIINDN